VTRLLAVRVRRWCLASLMVGLLAVAAPGAPALAQPAEGYVKFYAVRPAASGRAEPLSAIAQRLLGDPARSAEIFDLNVGRRQADGGALTDPGALTAGWLLIVPWDAVGDGVQVGLLPAGGSGAPSPAPSGSAAPGTAAGGGAGGNAECGPPGTGPAADLPWAQLRLAPDRAWTRGRGEGVTVAVLDSGVAAGVPALAGRVLSGTDVTGAGGRADTDCVGHGTAMAGIVAAGARGDTRFVGMAPDARILPVRLTDGDTVQLVAALEAATRAGASVVMLGVAVDLGDARTGAAVAAAVARGAVVVVPVGRDARAGTGRDGVLRVGAAGTDDLPAGKYPAGAVDVLAPGVNVASLSVNPAAQVTGTGPDFAVPFVAGVAALVRSVYPQLSPAQVADTIRRTSGGGGRSAPDPVTGWGMVDPGAAVGAAVRRDAGATHSQQVWSGGQGAGVLLGLAIVAALALALRRWGPLRRRPRTDHRGEAG
jgi:membrane-anchored mycosin MYCP